MAEPWDATEEDILADIKRMRARRNAADREDAALLQQQLDDGPPLQIAPPSPDTESAREPPPSSRTSPRKS